MIQQFRIKWIDHRRAPQCAPDPAYPKGRDIDMSTLLQQGWPTCRVELPYPAKRCGLYLVECAYCGMQFAATTAGRPDDPRSITLGCKKPEILQ